MMMRKKYIAKTNRLTTAKVKRDILGDHLCLTVKSGEAIDFKEVLEYPLSPIPESELSREY